nr:hypothetical protein [uncultured Flavobacterium sp.]
MIKNFNHRFDHDNDIQYNGYLLYKNKLINARTYEVLVSNEIKILLPINFDMNRKNRILHNKKDFSEYKLSFKEYRFVDNIDFLLTINQAYQLCKTTFKMNTDQINATLTLCCFQVFTKQDGLDILSQSGYCRENRIFNFLDTNGFLLRIDDLKEQTHISKRVYSFSEKGFSMVKLFYKTLDKTTVFEFKFKNKKELLVDSILKKYE